MSNFVCLCTFCEYHGPTVVMMTQPLRSQLSRTNPSADPGLNSCSSDVTGSQLHEADYELLSSNCGGEEVVPEPVSETEEKVYGGDALLRGLAPVLSGCGGCWSLGPARGAIFSSHRDKHTSYVSTQNGLGSTSRLAREAAFKSISCEVCPKQTGSMVFTNTTAATILSQTFFLKDYTSRGFQRFFSIIIGSKERAHALSSWTRLSQKVQVLIDLLSRRCEVTYLAETNGCNTRDLTEKNFLKKRERNEPLRNLSELVSDPAIFLVLHSHFSGLLADLENIKGEAAVVGQPVKSCLVFNEPRILLFLEIFSSLAPPSRRVLLYNLLAGRALGICCSSRELGRQVADALSAILPNNRDRDSTYFANVVLSPVLNSDLNQTLTVTGGHTAPSFSFTNRVCTCVQGHCSDCTAAAGSTAVVQLLNIMNCNSLNSCTVHTKVLTQVQGILHQAKVWAHLRGGAERQLFLRKFGLGASDERIFSFFKMFLNA